MGASGFISVVGHAAPRALRELYDAFDAGDLERAQKINAETMIPLIASQGRLGGVSFAKAALRLQGMEVGDPRLPVVAPDDAQLEDLRHDMTRAGVL